VLGTNRAASAVRFCLFLDAGELFARKFADDIPRPEAFAATGFVVFER
jgi:hypothetical protein